MVEVSLTVGKLDASLALLLTKDHHLIEFPTILLPNGVRAGSIVKIKCDRDLATEKTEAAQFQQIQNEILATFGTNLPQSPVLSIKNVTQTSCVLEWDALDLGTASLKNLVLFKDDKKLGAIPQPLTNRTTKLSGLPIDKAFLFQLRLDTTAGVYPSNVAEVKTHKMTDLSGITVCLGDVTQNDQFSVEDIQETLKSMGAHFPAQDKLLVDTTHFITTRENKQNPEYLKANEMNIPIIRPEWLKACERERRIVGVRDFYVKDCVLPDILAKNYWNKSGSLPQVPDKGISRDSKTSIAESQVVDELKKQPISTESSGPDLEKPVETNTSDLSELPNTEKLPAEDVPVEEIPAELTPAEEPPAEQSPVEESSATIVPIKAEPEAAGLAESLAVAEEEPEPSSLEEFPVEQLTEEIRIETFGLVPFEEVPIQKLENPTEISYSETDVVQDEVKGATEPQPSLLLQSAQEEGEFDLAEKVESETAEVNTDLNVETAESEEVVKSIEGHEQAEPAETITTEADIGNEADEPLDQIQPASAGKGNVEKLDPESGAVPKQVQESIMEED